jgi:hypothetical protein
MEKYGLLFCRAIQGFQQRTTTRFAVATPCRIYFRFCSHELKGPRSGGKKRSSKKGAPVPKTVLRLPDLDQAKLVVLNSLSSRDTQRGYAMRLMSSLSGTVRSRDCHSAKLLCFGIACTWNRRWLVTSRYSATTAKQRVVLKIVEFGEVFVPVEAVALFLLFCTSCL